MKISEVLDKGAIKLDTIAKNLNTLHPADLANVVEDLNFNQGARLVGSLDNQSAAKVIEELEPKLQKVLIKHLGPEKAAQIIEKMPIDEIVDLMAHHPDLIQRPIVEKGAKAILARPVERLKEIL